MTPIEEQIQECEQRLYRAQLESNVDELDALIADDLLFSGPNGHLFTKEDDLRMHRDGSMKVLTFEPLDTKINVSAPTIAVCTVLARVSGILQGSALEGTFRYMRVWQENSGQWRIVAGSLQIQK